MSFRLFWVIFCRESYCPNIPHTLPHRQRCQHSCCPVVHSCSNWETRLHSCMNPTSPWVSQVIFVLCVWLSVLNKISLSVHAQKTQMPFFCSPFLYKHVSAAMLEPTQKQSSAQKRPTAALNYINYHDTKHTLFSQGTGSSHNQQLIQ